MSKVDIGLENLADAMDYISYGRSKIANFISSNDGFGYSVISFPNTILSVAPNTSAQPISDIFRYDITVNGQFIPKESIVPIQNGSDLDIKINIAICEYGIESDDVVELIGKTGYVVI